MSNVRLFIDDFKKYLVTQDLSHNTVYNYIADINNFVHWYSECHAEEIVVKGVTSHHLNFFRDQLLKSRRLKISSVNRKIQTLKRFVKFLVDNQIIKNNIADSIKFIRKTKAIKPNPAIAD